jgi:hypothetical protein
MRNHHADLQAGPRRHGQHDTEDVPDIDPERHRPRIHHAHTAQAVRDPHAGLWLQENLLEFLGRILLNGDQRLPGGVGTGQGTPRIDGFAHPVKQRLQQNQAPAALAREEQTNCLAVSTTRSQQIEIPERNAVPGHRCALRLRR